MKFNAKTQGWLCPQCGRVWAPHIDKCVVCESVVLRPSFPEPDEIKKCIYYSKGECFASPERVNVLCGGDESKCCNCCRENKKPLESITTTNAKDDEWWAINKSEKLDYDKLFPVEKDGYEQISDGKVKSYFKKSECDSDWR